MGKVKYDEKRNNKKLSKSYLKKRKFGKIAKAGSNQPENGKARIIIRNISFKATENDIKSLYEPFGQLEEINVLRHPDGKIVGCAFVEFKNEADASKAIFKTNKTELLGRSISCTWALAKAKYVEKIKKMEDEKHDDSKIEVESSKPSGDAELIDIDDSDKRDQVVKEEKTPRKKKMTAEERKVQKLKKRKKRARIIIRNLPFKVTDESIKEFFSKFGTIEEVKLLNKSDGKRIGCGFVQFEQVQSAAKAIHHANMKPFLDRTIVVDWAMPKNTYKEKAPENSEDQEIKKEAEDDVEIKNEEIEEEEEEKSIDKNSDSEEEEEMKEESEFEDEDEDLPEPVHVDNAKNEGPRRVSNDVQEGKTVFLKNVPFRATKDDLKECMVQFGPVAYAVICMDPLTEHSKGTAFVKFQNIEDAEKCLAAGTELQLLNQVLDPHKALPRGQAPDKKNEEKPKTKDSRNLYLVREGVILAGTPAAKNISASDMARRLQLEQMKSQMLRNFNMFVSKLRLVIHNLPPNYDNAKLRKLFSSHSSRDAVITEANVMRDLKNVNEKGIGESKGHAFVSFTNHEDALKALRTINNNPKIFTSSKRPIVAFSIENRIMVNAKKRRIVKSRENNPLCSDYKKPKLVEEEPRAQKKTRENRRAEHGEDREYSGVQSKVGGPVKLGKKFNIKKQALLHAETLKNEKKKAKFVKQQKTIKQERRASRKEVKTKQKKKEDNSDEKQLQKYINNYKCQLNAATENKSKWYETG